MNVPSTHKKFCRYCRDTNESPIVYEGHFAYNFDGKAMCPKMRAKGCLTCGQKGEHSHCAIDCPQTKDKAEVISKTDDTCSNMIAAKKAFLLAQKPKKNQSLRVRLLKKLTLETIIRHRKLLEAKIQNRQAILKKHKKYPKKK